MLTNTIPAANDQVLCLAADLNHAMASSWLARANYALTWGHEWQPLPEYNGIAFTHRTESSAAQTVPGI